MGFQFSNSIPNPYIMGLFILKQTQLSYPSQPVLYGFGPFGRIGLWVELNQSVPAATPGTYRNIVFDGFIIIPLTIDNFSRIVVTDRMKKCP